MYFEHFGLTEAPFRITPHTEFFFGGANRGATLAALIYAVTQDEGIVKVSGEVGSGKTMLCRVLMERLPARVVTIYLANPSLSREDIVFAIADELGLNLPDNSRPGAVARALQAKLIEIYGEDRQVVVLIDEAHAMPQETLEEIRLLSNLESSQHKLLRLVLFGQPELDAVLARADMRQLKERITHHFELEPLHRDDIAEYLDFRLRAAGYRGPPLFTPEAVQLIARASQGLTRRVNILADKALLSAYSNNLHQVTPEQVGAAVRDAGYHRPGPDRRRMVLAGGALLGIGVFLGLAWRMGNPSPETSIPLAAPIAEASPGPIPATGMVASGKATPEKTVAAAPPASGPVVRSRLEQVLDESRRWVEATPGHHWFIQLALVDGRNADSAQDFLDRNSRLLPEQTLRAYQASLGDTRRIGFYFGDFADAQAAYAAIQKLPGELLSHKPHPRQVKAIK